MPWRSRWSSARLSSTAASGAKASVSSSWNEDASQTITAPGSSVPGRDASGVPTLPATTTGSPAVRWTWPISSTVVVLPFEPVSATNSCSSSRQPSSSSPITRRPARERRVHHRRLARHARALDHGRDAGEQVRALLPVAHLHARRHEPLLDGRRRSPERPSRPPARRAPPAPPPRPRPSGRGRRRETGRAGAAGARSRPSFKRAALNALAARPRRCRSQTATRRRRGSGPGRDAPPCAGGRRTCRRARTDAWSRTCATSGRRATGARRRDGPRAARPRRGR